jgi:hypothetical protein
MQNFQPSLLLNWYQRVLPQEEKRMGKAADFSIPSITVVKLHGTLLEANRLLNHETVGVFTPQIR